MARLALQYDGVSELRQESGASVLRFYPNLLRGPANLKATVAEPLVFRDALETISKVVESKLYRSRDEIVAAILDPLITVTRDDVHYEAFSLDESTYVRLSSRPGTFSDVRTREPGCTNIELSRELKHGLAQLRRRESVGLHIARSGAALQSSKRVVRERKVDLPASWMRGFLEVQSSLRLPCPELECHPRDLRNVIAYLKHKKARTSPRGLRLTLRPNEKPTVVFEPWNDELRLTGSRYRGLEDEEVVLWGRRRLLLLEPLLPSLQNVRVRLLGTGKPSFWICDLGASSLTLGMSPWTSREWTTRGALQLFAPVIEWQPDELDEVYEQLAGGVAATREELASSLGWTESRVEAALGALCVQGRTLYDPEREAYVGRQVFDRPPEPHSSLGYREKRAQALLNDDKVSLRDSSTVEAGQEARGAVAGRKHYEVEIAVDTSGKLVAGFCGCVFSRRYGLSQGPCSHMLALRLAALAAKPACR